MGRSAAVAWSALTGALILWMARDLAWASPEALQALMAADLFVDGGPLSLSTRLLWKPAASPGWVRVAQGVLALGLEPVGALRALGVAALVGLGVLWTWALRTPWPTALIALCVPLIQASSAGEAMSVASLLVALSLLAAASSQGRRLALGSLAGALGAGLYPPAAAAWFVGLAVAWRRGLARDYAWGGMLLGLFWAWSAGLTGWSWPQWDPAGGWAALWPMWVGTPLAAAAWLALPSAWSDRRVQALGGGALAVWGWALCTGGSLTVGKPYFVALPWLLAALGLCMARWRRDRRVLVGMAAVSSLALSVQVQGLLPQEPDGLPPRAVGYTHLFFSLDRLEQARQDGLALGAALPDPTPGIALQPGQEALAYYAGVTSLVPWLPESEAAPMAAQGVDLRLAWHSPAPPANSHTLATVGGLPVELLRYHTPTVQGLVREGAVIVDFPANLPAWIQQVLPGLSPEQAGAVLAEFDAYYFDHNLDPGLRAPLAAAAGRD
ncbi:MAG: hypothetical protein VX899_03695 [Myxococcota bacterium]|nr:hypothetical protein [Myxococcota bacterium]